MSEGVSSHVTGAVLYLHSPDRPHANRYKWVKKELLFHAGGVISEAATAASAHCHTAFPISYPP